MQFTVSHTLEGENLDDVVQLAQGLHDDACLLAEDVGLSILASQFRTIHDVVDLQPSRPGVRLAFEHPGRFAYRPSDAADMPKPVEVPGPAVLPGPPIVETADELVQMAHASVVLALIDSDVTTLQELPGALAELESREIIEHARKLDSRKGAVDGYAKRLAELSETAES